ncbi:KipI antagonist [bioreactor metagenome]|uniref:KipI antagonist n=1 Tax=bioreactor metagenome TaxID=1076179 RepID=A0A644TR69_9ZZZZ|nr:biotin-dependent carboxyltransferase family protein [Negativicutes bacterium]
MQILEVIESGLLTTVQDLGRWGYQKFGVPVAGAMDGYSLRLANRLVGNQDNAAGLEVTMMGPTLAFCRSACVAVTGGDLSPQINGQDIAMWETVAVEAGDILSFAGLESGCRAYIAIAGGIEVPVVMGSRATYLRGKLGGFQGRQLRKGDCLEVGRSNSEVTIGSRVPAGLIPEYGEDYRVRVVLGPQDDYFTVESIAAFLAAPYIVTLEADRMGYRLEGAKIPHKAAADIISDGISLGSIQVPGHGRPIVMLADRQTTGGYTKIATVISSDIPMLAQAKPGDRVRFSQITVAEANSILRTMEEKLAAWNPIRPIVVQSGDCRSFQVKVNGCVYQIEVRES